MASASWGSGGGNPVGGADYFRFGAASESRLVLAGAGAALQLGEGVEGGHVAGVDAFGQSTARQRGQPVVGVDYAVPRAGLLLKASECRGVEGFDVEKQVFQGGVGRAAVQMYHPHVFCGDGLVSFFAVVPAGEEVHARRRVRPA